MDAVPELSDSSPSPSASPSASPNPDTPAEVSGPSSTAPLQTPPTEVGSGGDELQSSATAGHIHPFQGEDFNPDPNFGSSFNDMAFTNYNSTVPLTTPPSLMLSSEEPGIISEPQVPLRDIPGSGSNMPSDIRRSTRSVIPSKRSEQLNKIGGNDTDVPHPGKENIPPQGHFLLRDLGEDWVACVEKWFELEEKLGFGEVPGTKTALPAVSTRPEEWTQWTMKTRGGVRRYDALPFIADSADLGIAIAKWWSAMQPGFRKSDDNIPASVYDTDNALLDRTQYQTDSTNEWRRMVADIKTCMIVIASTTDTTKKRKAPGDRMAGRKRLRV
ncbi:hypothetical protein HYPSUDRAFT_207108 [Hypholoma sublateritium FD-334 SS-4]|uniref:Uncharacterized protein n=1 Tax=Hypholoma sublateritium (strain FD-334 SS-4) TaxID=945553 RepID=A0A0D2NB73_HYPSF|nr:hypothetical protein HYPSUDRAFT_207108 [Hypholoma sublateritium FD-334 SS-4]